MRLIYFILRNPLHIYHFSVVYAINKLIHNPLMLPGKTGPAEYGQKVRRIIGEKWAENRQKP